MSMCKQSAVGFPNYLAESIADSYLREGLLPSHIEQIVPIYGNHCDAMAEGIRKYFPKGTKFVLPDGGMFLWVELPGDPQKYDMNEIQMRALRDIKVAFMSGLAFCTIPGTCDNKMRLNFTAASMDMIDIGLNKLGNMLKEYV